MPDLDSLSTDQRLALKTAAGVLQDEFVGVFSVETIELFLQTSYDQFADRAKFTNFLPLMAERFARQRLAALARVEGKADDGVPIVLFLCVHNAGSSTTPRAEASPGCARSVTRSAAGCAACSPACRCRC